MISGSPGQKLFALTILSLTCYPLMHCLLQFYSHKLHKIRVLNSLGVVALSCTFLTFHGPLDNYKIIDFMLSKFPCVSYGGHIVWIMRRHGVLIPANFRTKSRRC